MDLETQILTTEEFASLLFDIGGRLRMTTRDEYGFMPGNSPNEAA
jgi:hypothetical protein